VTINISTEHQREAVSPSPMPTAIRVALALLWLSLAYSFLWVSYTLYSLYVNGAFLAKDEFARAASHAMIRSYVVTYLGYICHAYLNICIAHKKNWARIAKLLLVVGIPVYYFIVRLIQSSPDVIIPPMELTLFKYFLNGVGSALNFAALYLLFLSPGKLWFRRMPPQAGSEP
jgi:hypothetical protein